MIDSTHKIPWRFHPKPHVVYKYIYQSSKVQN